MGTPEKMRALVRASLQEHPILDGVSVAVRATILEQGLIRVYAPGTLLNAEGDPSDHYWFLCSGSARVFYRSPDGFEVTVKIFQAPAAWAEMEILTGHPHIEDCAAVDKATALLLPKQVFVRLLDEDRRFSHNVLYDTCSRFLIAAQNERALAFMPVEQRLAHMLLAYVRVYGVAVAGGVGIRIKLSHSDLARDLGVVKKSVTRTLARWREQRLLSKSGTSLVIHDVKGLARIASHELIGVDWIAGSRVDESRGTQLRQRPRSRCRPGSGVE